MRWPFRLGIYVVEIALLIGALVGTQVLSARLWMLPNGDVDEYYAYAQAFWTNHPLFHSIPVEYPLLAILPFSLTILPNLPHSYHIVFAVWMGALVVAGYIGFLRYADHTRALMYAVYLLLGTSATLLARFDIVPALATLAALWLAERGRFTYAYILIAAGVLLKLYPAFLIPVIVIEQWRQTDAITRADVSAPMPAPDAAGRRRVDLPRAVRQFWQRGATQQALRGVSLCFGLILGCFALSVMLNPAGTLSGFQYAGNRPLQVESTPASILWLGSIFGIPAYPNYSFVSLNYVGLMDSVLKPASAVALACGCLWVYVRQAQGRLTIGQAFIACLGIVLVTNKIFSPQYLIWIIPIVAYVEGLDLLWLAICFLTWYDYPILYQLHHPIQTVTYGWQFMPALALRNGLLLYVTLRVILRPTRRLYHSGGASADHGALAGRAGTTDREEGGDIEHALAR